MCGYANVVNVQMCRYANVQFKVCKYANFWMTEVYHKKASAYLHILVSAHLIIGMLMKN